MPNVSELDTIKQQPWFQYMDTTQQELVVTSLRLLAQEQAAPNDFDDYSYLVFPMAKAFEGLLKRFFFDLGIISKQVFEGRHFRIGKSLNPELFHKHRGSDWVVDDLDALCYPVDDGKWAGKKISWVLWQQWQECRNELFHYFPQHSNCITLDQAAHLIGALQETFSLITQCRRDHRTV